MHGWVPAQQGKFDAGLAEMQEARLLDPLSPPVNGHIGWFLYLAQRSSAAVAQLEATLALARHPMTLHSLALAYCANGQMEKAKAAVDECVDLSMSHALPLSAKVHIYLAAGRRTEAEVLQQLETMLTTRIVSPYFLALAYAGMGDIDRCFQFLFDALEDRSIARQNSRGTQKPHSSISCPAAEAWACDGRRVERGAAL
jgi:tetratricopeptide (TPR) repeat protein